MKTINLVNPILIFNLGVEMIHIIHQRLIVQKIEKERIGDYIALENAGQYQVNGSSNIWVGTDIHIDGIDCSQFNHQVESVEHEQSLLSDHHESQDVYPIDQVHSYNYTSAPVEIYHLTLKHFNGIEQLGLGQMAQKTLNTCLEQFNQLYAKLTPEEYAAIKIELLKACQQKLNKQSLTTLNKGELYNKQQSKPSEIFQQKSITHNLNLDPNQQQQELNDLAKLLGTKQCNYEPITLFNQQIRQSLQEDPEQLQIQVTTTTTTTTNKSTTMKQNIMEQFKESDGDGEQDLLDLMDQANDY